MNMLANPIETITRRHSTRSYLPKPLEPSVRKELYNFINSMDNGPFNQKIKFQLIEKDIKNKNLLTLNYGMITNHFNYILGVSEKDRLSRMNYGYFLENIVLKATELELATCWIGYFDSSFFSDFALPDGFEIPSIIIIGYPTEKPSLGQRFTRLSVNASKRNEWEKIFFLDNFNTPLIPDQAGIYRQVLEMVRLAPSSGNTQPWRIILNQEKQAFYFF